MLFAQQAGVKVEQIPEKGSNPLIADMMGGFVKVGFNPIPVSRAALDGGFIRALAVTSAKHSTLMPQLPTLAESGLEGFDATLSYGLLAPAGTPRLIIDRLNKELRAALANEDVRKRLINEGGEPGPTTPRGTCRSHRPRGGQVVGRHSRGGEQARSKDQIMATTMTIIPARSAVSRRRVIRGALAAGVAAPILLRAGSAFAAYPDRPVKFVVANTPGGPSDIVARIVTAALSQSTGKTFIVENRGGAGGNIGMEYAARAEPDGYTILLATNAYSVNYGLYNQLPYDPYKDFVAVSESGRLRRTRSWSKSESRRRRR